jgi:hypothetical protein
MYYRQLSKLSDREKSPYRRVTSLSVLTFAALR